MEKIRNPTIRSEKNNYCVFCVCGLRVWGPHRNLSTHISRKLKKKCIRVCFVFLCALRGEYYISSSYKLIKSSFLLHKRLLNDFILFIFTLQQSDGEKSDQDLVVDDASEISPLSPMPNQHHSNGTASPRENGMMIKKMDHQDRDRIGPHSPRSGTSSNASTPSNKKLEDNKPSTPIAKSVTPTGSNQSNGLGGGGGSVGGGSSSSGSGGPGGSNGGLNGGGPPLGPAGALVKAVANKPPAMNPNFPHYLGPLNGGGPPHDMQAAAVAAAAAAAAAAAGYGGPPGGHNPNIPPGLNNYPRAPLQVGFDPHPQMRAPPLGAALTGIPGGKP